DRIIVGSDDQRAIAMLRSLYAPFQRNRERIIVMSVRSAELTKYAANAMLATRISFMNEVANLAEALGADIEEVRRGIGSGPRIGYQFLYAGVGFGGSCFPKDVKALQRSAQEAGKPLRLLGAVEEVNEAQKHVLGFKIRDRFDNQLRGKCIAVWGLAFKANTDDMREAPSLALIDDLVAAGASVRAYDPAAGAEARKLFADSRSITIVEHALDALEGPDALGARTRLLSVVGRDDAGARLARMLKGSRVDARLHRDARVHTTQKLRVIGRRQQLLRIDMEAPPSQEVLAAKLAEYRDALKECDVVLLSDYGKGGLEHIGT